MYRISTERWKKLIVVGTNTDTKRLPHISVRQPFESEEQIEMCVSSKSYYKYVVTILSITTIPEVRFDI